MTAQCVDLSIIIPTYNRPEQLAACLGALCRQDYSLERFEVIVVDDGSNVPVDPMAWRYAKTLDIKIERISNGGPAAARNHGARIARGRFLAFTDDDCAPSAGWLAALAKTLNTNPEVLTGGKIQNALSENTHSVASQLILDFIYDYYALCSRPFRFFASNNMALASEFFQEVGGFNPHFRTSEDRDLCDRWEDTGRQLVYVPEALVYHSNELNFRSFWQQHLGYGRGAFRFYQAHQHRHPNESSIVPSFYLALARRLPALIMRQNRHRLLLTSLMVLWQMANTAGFLQEACFFKKAVQAEGKL
jgi:GT2 family glycosyltransferase